MVKHKKTIHFEADERYHITDEEAFETAYSMFETLQKICPGCSMGVASALMTMLAIHYTKEDIKRGKIFEYEDWIKSTGSGAIRAVNNYQRTGTTTQ
jgi:cysteine synthase